MLCLQGNFVGYHYVISAVGGDEMSEAILAQTLSKDLSGDITVFKCPDWESLRL